jgi:hypothetical protein
MLIFVLGSTAQWSKHRAARTVSKFFSGKENPLRIELFKDHTYMVF